MSDQELQNLVEAILFYKAEPVEIAWLCKHIEVEPSRVETAVDSLQQALQARGVRLVRTKDTLELGTAPETSAYIEKLLVDELSHNLGKAGLETLSIILYKGPISRSGIDQIRGVNSQYVLRNLLIRGLIERVENKDDMRSLLYRPTTTLYKHLGLSGESQLPDRESILEQLSIIEQAHMTKEDEA